MLYCALSLAPPLPSMCQFTYTEVLASDMAVIGDSYFKL